MRRCNLFLFTECCFEVGKTGPRAFTGSDVDCACKHPLPAHRQERENESQSPPGLWTPQSPEFLQSAQGLINKCLFLNCWLYHNRPCIPSLSMRIPEAVHSESGTFLSLMESGRRRMKPTSAPVSPEEQPFLFRHICSGP